MASLTPCVEWPGARNRHGYGVVGTKLVPSRLAHRVAWEAANGRIPDGLQCLHRCDNPACVNVEHLFLGTPRDNSDDKTAKGRARCGQSDRRGELNAMVKLTEEQVLAIRGDGRSQRRIAKDYPVSQQTVCDIKLRRRWAWLQP